MPTAAIEKPVKRNAADKNLPKPKEEASNWAATHRQGSHLYLGAGWFAGPCPQPSGGGERIFESTEKKTGAEDAGGTHVQR